MLLWCKSVDDVTHNGKQAENNNSSQDRADNDPDEEFGIVGDVLAALYRCRESRGARHVHKP